MPVALNVPCFFLLMVLKRPVRIVFADDSLKTAFEQLCSAAYEEKELYIFISRALNDIKEKPAGYIHIQKTRWPKEYVQKYNITNLWKYDLPNGWRLIYTIQHEDVAILCIILEWFSHKEYERRFGY